MTFHADQDRVVVVGAGIGGLATALKLAPMPVTVLSAAPIGQGAATAWAQGGIAAAIGPDDSAARHRDDTLAVACGIADPEVVAVVAGEAPGCVAELMALGVPFDRAADGAFHLGREGGHSRRRVLHAVGDRSGAEILRVLLAVARAHPSITLVGNSEAEVLLQDEGRVAGVVMRHGSERTAIAGRAVVLATGGIGGLYRYTTNPTTARGRGVALAARAGATLADLEFIQFHPTALRVDRDPMPLVTEALRGEGAVLIDEHGRRLMTGRHPLADLAPRDIVARAIWRHRRNGGEVYLDARQVAGGAFPEHFPTVYAACIAAGIDPTETAIPVAPAAHYQMGGVKIDIDGRSSVAGLWAVGEVSASGLHGANRLASNSLLEALVFARRAASAIKSETSARVRPMPPPPDGPPIAAADRALIARLRTTMNDAVGLERQADDLVAAAKSMRGLAEEAQTLARATQDAVLVGRLVTCAAERRRESRGAHYRRDFPDTVPAAAHRSVLSLADLDA
ncbi:MAG: L-aspartate oxidase [Alphaproteobacteria bacterium]|nr:L-aspartate oxidase [Alphaproteobacteria bacterium]